MLAAWIIWLYNHIHMEFQNPYASHGSLYFLEICQRCGEPCFSGAAVSLDAGICRKFPGGTGISHYRPNESFVEHQFNVSA
jgi:hypothetical protein